METLILMQVCKSAALVDLGSFTLNATNHLVVVEHTYKMVSSVLEVPREKTQFEIWTLAPETFSFGKISDLTLEMPVASALALDLTSNQLTVLTEVNKSVPGFCLRAPLRNGTLPVSFSEAPQLLPVRLPFAVAAQIQLEPTETWNTTTLPPSGWLFNPNVLANPENSDRYLSFNTADARCVIFRLKSGSDASQILGFFSGFLEPSLQKVGNRILLFGRRPTVPWSVFFHSPRHSGQYGPLPLPLRLAALDSEWKTDQPRDLSDAEQLGAVFIYATAVNAADELALAVVAGSKAEPKLCLYLSRDGANRFEKRSECALPAVPRNLTITLSRQRALIGVTLRGADRDEIQAQDIALTP